MRHRHRSLALPGLSVLLALSAALLVPLPANAAPEGARIISGVHVDAVAIALTDGALSLGSRANVDGETGASVDPDTTVFNVESATRVTLGRGSNLPFLGDIGNEFWIAPQANPGDGILWPGFSTEDVPGGTLDDDALTLSLTHVDGPGFVSIFQTGSFGDSVQILDSRDSAFTSWPLTAGQHAHANWAFSATGSYTLTFEASGVIDGVSQSMTQDYHFFVGNTVPAALTSVSTPAVSTREFAAGSELTVSASVTPAEAVGTLEFITDAGHLGSATVEEGQATIVTDQLPIGRQTISARFQPDSTDDFTASVSSPTTVTVTPSRAAADLTITGMPTTFSNGQTATLTAGGPPPAPGENYNWVMRFVGDSTWQTIYDDTTYRPETGSTFTRDFTSHYNGYEIALQLLRDHIVLGQSEPVAPVVTGPSTGSGLEIAVTGVLDVFEYGDYADLTVTGAPLPDGARYEWFYYYPRSQNVTVVTDLGDPSSVERKSAYPPVDGILDFGVRAVDAAGTVLGTSPLYSFVTTDAPELHIEGIQSFYRPGDPITLTASVSPADTRFTQYRWQVSANGENTVIEGATGNTVTLPASTDLNKATISVMLVEPTHGVHTIGYDTEEIIVLDLVDGANLLYFNPLARHYHSNDTVNLHLVSSSDSAAHSYRWYLKRADQADFVLLPGVSTPNHTLKAEVALAAAQVTAELVDPDGTVLATADTITIAVDDHGSPPARHLSVTADSPSYTVGDTATFTATATAASVLNRYEWWVTRAGESEPSLLEVVRGNQLDVVLDSGFIGASLTARLTKDTAETYSESEAFAITVSALPTIPAEPALPGAPTLPAPGQPLPPISGAVPTAGLTDPARGSVRVPTSAPADTLANTGMDPASLALTALALLALGLGARHRRRRVTAA